MSRKRYLSIETLIDGLASGQVLTLLRYRTHDHAIHCFEFQLARDEDPHFRCVERFENGLVQEDFMDMHAIAILCNWLLYLNFEPNLFSPYSDSEEN